MVETGRGVIAFGIAAVAVAVAAAALAWWRWERTTVVAGDIPLPPGTEVLSVRSREARVESREPACTFSCRAKLGPEEVRAHFLESLIGHGWEVRRSEEHRLSMRLDGRMLRLVLHPHRNWTDFTIDISPCRQQ